MQTAEVRIGDAPAQPFRAFDGGRFFGICKRRTELIATIARNEIGSILSPLRAIKRQLPQERIRAGMPATIIPALNNVVDGFEARTTYGNDALLSKSSTTAADVEIRIGDHVVWKA
jgi:hypothetical protein